MSNSTLCPFCIKRGPRACHQSHVCDIFFPRPSALRASTKMASQVKPVRVRRRPLVGAGNILVIEKHLLTTHSNSLSKLVTTSERHKIITKIHPRNCVEDREFPVVEVTFFAQKVVLMAKCAAGSLQHHWLETKFAMYKQNVLYFFYTTGGPQLDAVLCAKSSHCTCQTWRTSCHGRGQSKVRPTQCAK